MLAGMLWAFQVSPSIPKQRTLAFADFSWERVLFAQVVPAPSPGVSIGVIRLQGGEGGICPILSSGCSALKRGPC